jgi:hypothetical protein
VRPSYFVWIRRDGTPDSIEPITPLGAGNPTLSSAMAKVDRALMEVPGPLLLALVDPRQAEIVAMRFFGGLSVE